MQVYVSKGGQRYGPYAVEQLRQYVEAGNFVPTDHACCDGANWVNLNAFLFNASFGDGPNIEIQINPEFGDVDTARTEASKYAVVIGRLPKCIRKDVETVWIHKGNEPFGGGNNNLLIHTGQAAQYLASGILEETLVHEGAHTSLDDEHAGATGWLAAQNADGEFISGYARDNPDREDIAESFLLYFALRHRSKRISQSLADTVSRTIPNRIVYFDNQEFDMNPLKKVNSRNSTYVVSLTSNPNNAGAFTGDGSFDEGNATAISATPNPGYLFTGWSGDASGATNPLTITVNTAKNISANFAQDLSDDDGDGLSNYAELVTHGTKADDNDTDDDGLLDGEETQIGANPKSSDATLVNYLNSRAAARETTARTNALAEGRAAGVAAVKANPSAYGLTSAEKQAAPGATPHTNSWYYQPEWGWIWTNATVFPYVYRSSIGGKTEGWLYFMEGSSPPSFHDYATGSLVTPGG